MSGEPCLAAKSRYFDDLLEVIASFATGWRFEVCAEVLMHLVGMGCYRKEASGVSVLQEEGACESFGLFLQHVLVWCALLVLPCVAVRGNLFDFLCFWYGVSAREMWRRILAGKRF